MLKFEKTQGALDKFKRYVDKYNCPVVTMDLSRLNIIDTAKVLVLSSTYHYQKYPKGKLKCHVPSADIKTFVSNFYVKNLELI
jgi:ABC-type transporter Mla MlaB component